MNSAGDILKEKGDFVMSILKEFDKALVLEETQQGNVKSGYIVEETGRKYPEYLHKDSWEALKRDMDPEHKKQYGAGGGKELDEKNGKPPKMASFASSSRMIYNYSKDIPGFVFEKKLSTTVGGMANLDGYLELPDKYIFVEAKCREPYGHKAEQIIKQNYHDIYAYLREKMPDNFSCVMEDIQEEKEDQPKRNMRVAFFCKGKSVAHFDIKQMICHLLSVATDGLKYQEDRDRLFLYFLYNPFALQMPQEAKVEIMRIYDDTCWVANHFDFKVMFGHIVDFLRVSGKIRAEDEYIAYLKNSFNFMLCDQNTYKEQLK